MMPLTPPRTSPFQTWETSIPDPTGGIIWEVEGRGSGSKGVAHHTDSPTQVEVFDLGW